jgi:glyoxylase-like metal-dependent hydrolase (beta-lactamase superfamily II)
MLRETFEAGAFACNCSVLACDETRKAIVIDPGGEVERIAEIVRSNDLEVVAIIHTHAHLDHIFCTRDVKEQHGGEICLHRDDLPLYNGIKMQAAMFNWPARDTLPVERFVSDGDVIEFGAKRAEVLHTPGHTPGSVCFQLEVGGRSLIFAGDTLFRRGIGRTDLPGGNSRQILTSIRERLYNLDPDALVIPGHGPNTTIAEEAAKNPFVTARDPV